MGVYTISSTRGRSDPERAGEVREAEMMRSISGASSDLPRNARRMRGLRAFCFTIQSVRWLRRRPELDLGYVPASARDDVDIKLTRQLRTFNTWSDGTSYGDNIASG